MYRYCFILFTFISVSVYSQEIQNGYSRINYPNGNIASEGPMVNGKPDGFWKTYYVNGVKKSEGKRFNHQLDSIWVFFTETGDTSERITYLNGKKNGWYYKYKMFTELNSIAKNNLISKELYINDVREGNSTYYFDNGAIQAIVNYKNNKRHGTTKEFDKNGTLISIVNYSNGYISERIPLNRSVDGKPDGLWREYYTNGNIKTEKHFKEGVLDGYVKDFKENGTIENNQLYSEGKVVSVPAEDTLDIEERISYFPDKKIKTRFYFKKNIPVGIHREYNENGEVIKSWIYNNEGLLTGSGIITDEGIKSGKFTYYYDDGSVKSEGEYMNNRQNGKWLFYFKNRANEQIGNFSNGYLNGEWKWFFSDSSVLRIENFDNNRRIGKFVEFNNKGDTITRGYYSDNKKTGNWYVNSGDTYEAGNYQNDLKEGEWITYYSNGKIYYRGNYKDGLPVGKHELFYDNGTLKEEQYYVMGLREKTWKKYNEDGLLALTITFQNDTETRVNGYKLEIVK